MQHDSVRIAFVSILLALTPALGAGQAQAQTTAETPPAARADPPSAPLHRIVLRTATPGVSLELSSRTYPLPPLECVTPCAVQLLAGSYDVRVLGGGDVNGAPSSFAVHRDLDVAVRIPSERRRRTGKALGIAGIPTAGAGLFVTFLGLVATAFADFCLDLGSTCDSEVEDCPCEDESNYVSPLVPIGLTMMAASTGFEIGGWITYARNTGPGLKTAPIASSVGLAEPPATLASGWLTRGGGLSVAVHF